MGVYPERLSLRKHQMRIPINVMLDWPMGTTVGYVMFTHPAVNAQFKRIFDVWARYLSSPASRY